jgi:hypothetical protein
LGSGVWARTRKQRIERHQLTIHADRGSSMPSIPVAHLLADLCVTKSHSRPRCSNDDPYSESQFRTLKYRPDFPAPFGSFEDAHGFCGDFFGWYNNEHRHSGIAFHTPADVRYGRADTIRAHRAEVLDAAYAAHPERFVRHPPTPPALPKAAWITSRNTRRVFLRNASPSVFHQRHIGWVLRSSCNPRGRRLASSRGLEPRPGRCPSLWPGDVRNDGGSVAAAGADGNET